MLEVALHTRGRKLLFDYHTHEQYVDLFHAIGDDRARIRDYVLPTDIALVTPRALFQDNHHSEVCIAASHH